MRKLSDGCLALILVAAPFVQGQAAMEASSAGSELPHDPALPRICVSLTRVALGGEAHKINQLSEPITDLAVEYLQGPIVEVISIKGRIVAQVRAEAIEANCNALLEYRLMYQPASKRGAKAFAAGEATVDAAGAISRSPSIGVASDVGSAIGGFGKVFSGGDDQEQYSNTVLSTYKNDQVTMEAVLWTVGTWESGYERTQQAKAKRDGEELITPMLEMFTGDVLDRIAGGGQSAAGK